MSLIDDIKSNPVALFSSVLGVSVVVDTVLGAVLPLSLFYFWTQFFLGFMVGGAGCGLAYWTLVTLEKSGAPVGMGAAPRLVTDGPYAFTRNPLYISMTIVYVGVAIFFDAPLALIALFPLLYHVGKTSVPYEESILANTFGPEYDSYRSRVRRWF